jgi:ubiquitin thioesterase protein OTUB1
LPSQSHANCLLTIPSGHYDLLYKYEDVPPPPPSTESVAAYLSHNAPHPQYESIGDYSDAADNLMFIPGMSIAPSSNGWLSGPGYGSDFFTTPFAPLQTCAPAVPTPVAPAPQPQMLSQTTPQPAYGAGAQASHVMPPTQIPTELAIRSMPHAEHAGVPPLNPKADGPFRPSHYEYEADYLQTMSHHMPLTTSIFKK